MPTDSTIIAACAVAFVVLYSAELYARYLF